MEFDLGLNLIKRECWAPAEAGTLNGLLTLQPLAHGAQRRTEVPTYQSLTGEETEIHVIRGAGKHAALLFGRHLIHPVEGMALNASSRLELILTQREDGYAESECSAKSTGTPEGASGPMWIKTGDPSHDSELSGLIWGCFTFSRFSDI